MRKERLYSALIQAIILLFFVIFTLGCEKDDENIHPVIEKDAVTDIDGNVYDAVTLGDQTWMTENLKTSKYRNGDPIPTGLNDDDWSNTSDGAHAVYDENSSNNATYGKLYNWYTVIDNRNLCPDGWHVPTDAEWSALVDYLGGEGVAGRKLKEAGTAHWRSPNEATDKSMFSALPGGQRGWYGKYASLGDYGYWWSSSEGFASASWGWTMVYATDSIKRFNYTWEVGFSVRCIKD